MTRGKPVVEAMLDLHPGDRPRQRKGAGGIAAVISSYMWLPFFLADPGTVRALHYTIVNTALSGLRVLHVTSARTPPWDRPVQALVGAALGVAAGWESRVSQGHSGGVRATSYGPVVLRGDTPWPRKTAPRRQT